MFLSVSRPSERVLPGSPPPPCPPCAVDHQLLDLGHIIVGEQSLLSPKSSGPPPGGI